MSTEHCHYDKRWSILQVVNLGTLMSTLDVGIVNIAMPTLARRFSAPLAQIQWMSTIYLITMVSLLPVLGKLSDRWDRRIIYSLGFLLFSIGSFFVACSRDFAAALMSRCLQGIGATMMMANSQAMVREVFPEHERGRALGFNAVVISLGTLSGPAIGGLLLQYLSWHWLFALNVPIGFAAYFLGLRWFPSTKSNLKVNLDLLGAMLLSAGTCLLMLAAEGSKESVVQFYAIAEAAAGIIFLIFFWLYERRLGNGIWDRDLFERSPIFYGNASSFLINLAQTATLISITFYLQMQLKLSVEATGSLLLLQPLIMGIAAPFSGWFRDKYGAYLPIMVGASCCAASMIVVIGFSHTSVWMIGVQLALFGIGMGLFHSTNNAEIMSASPNEKASLSGSMLAVVRYLGQIFGIGLATLFVGNWGLHPSLSTGNNTAMKVLFSFCLLSCLSVSILVKQHKGGKFRLPQAVDKG